MDYGLHWIDGPAPGDARDEYVRRARFHASEPIMTALREEMKRQGMIGSKTGVLVGEWQAKFREGGQVTRNELVAALATATNDPAPPDQLDMSMEKWRECWERWLDFLVGALNYGGFRVERT